MSPDGVDNTGTTTGTLAVLSTPPGDFLTPTIRDDVQLQLRAINDTAAITLYEQKCASDALHIANMERHLHAIQVKTEEDRQSHVTVLQHGDTKLYATQQHILANEAHAATTAHKAATDAATAATRIEYLMQEASQQQLIHEDTNRRLAQTQSAITNSHITNAARINDTQNALVHNTQSTQAHVAQVAASTPQGFAVVQHQAQASASAMQASASASEPKHITTTEALAQRINSLISANDNAVRESHNASNAALVAQHNFYSTAAALQKVLDKRPTLPTAIKGQGVLSKKTME
jgi:hypothetical protein